MKRNEPRRITPSTAAAAFLAGLIAVTGLPAQPRETIFKELTIHQGLSQNTVNALIQDHLGFVWIGTDDGLNRFDGYQMIKYYSDPKEDRTLSHSGVLSLCEDARGRLWIGTVSGINRLDSSSGRFIRYPVLDKDIDSSDRDYVMQVYCDSRRQLWAGTLEGLYRYQPESDSFRKCALVVDETPLGSPAPVYQIAEDSTGNLLLGIGDEGILKTDLDSTGGGELTLEPLCDGSPRDKTVRSIMTDKQGGIWFIADLREVHYYSANGQYSVQTPANNASMHGDLLIQCILETDYRYIMLGTYTHGLFFLNRSSMRVSPLKIKKDTENFLQSGNIQALMQDEQSSIWAGTAANGIRIIAEKKSDIHLYEHDKNDPASLSSNEIFAIAEDSDGFLWIGTAKGGVDRFHPDMGVIQRFKHNPADANSLCNNNVWTLVIDRAGDVWMGTDEGLDRYTPRNGTFTHYTESGPSRYRLSDARILTLSEDSTGLIWIGTNGGGVNVYDRKSDSMRHISWDPADTTSLKANFITALYTDPEGTVWIGSFNGLSRYNRETDSFTNFPSERYPFLGTSLHAIYDDGNGSLWLGSRRGITRYTKGTGAFKTYSMKDGLPNNMVNAIVSDTYHDIWFTTNQGLSQLKTKSEEIINYQPADGLQSTEFNVGAGYRNRAGQLFFGGLYGLNVFHPDSLHTVDMTVPLRITSLELFKAEDILEKKSESISFEHRSILTKDSLTLKWYQNTFSLRFAALDFINPARIRYTYRMEGFQDAWVDIGERHMINFTNLPPGEYRFDVHASDGSGVWITDITSMTIIIKKAFWQTLFFRLLILFLLVHLLFLWIRMRIRHVHRRNRRLKKIVQHRTKKLNQQRSELAEKNLTLQIEIKRRREMENTLRIAEEKYRTFIEQTHEGIFRLDFDEPIPVTLPVEEQVALFYTYGYVGECNQALAVMYGYKSAEDLMGVRLVTLHGGDDNDRNLQAQADFVTSGYRTLNIVTEEIDRHGTRQIFNNNAVGTVDDGHLVYIWGTQSNITDRIKAEESIRKSLQEKEVLLKEIHHRVKNNLAVISSLLNLQARHIEDHSVKELFRESQSRVTSMARIHEKIYQSDDLAHINFANYITSTTQNLFSLYNINRSGIELDIKVNKVELAVDTAVPCGLILNELVSNSLKYAFPPGFEGKAVITIGMHYLDSGMVELIVQDNGVGIPDHIDLKNAESLGLKLIYILAEEQLDGTVTVDQKEGTKFRITFAP
ncbi:PAS domain-containing protein [bacterium]|nr:PAS domain-containing protein [bacterium]